MIRFQNLARHPDIGSNSYLIEFGDTGLILDAGTHPKHPGSETLPRFEELSPNQIDGVVISHPHLDHIGALPVLLREQAEATVIMTEPTKESGSALLHNSVNVMKSQRRELGISEYPLYSHREIDRLSQGWLTKEIEQPFSIGDTDRVRCQFFHAGHVLGAVGVQMDFEGHRVFYTGDVHFENQTLTQAARFPEEELDTLIIETTRGDSARDPDYTREKEKQRMGSVIRECIAHGGTVLLPVFAFGKTQEVLLMLRELSEEGIIPPTPVHIGGLSTRMTRIADKFCDRAGRNYSGYKIMEEFPDLHPVPRGRGEPDFYPGHIYALSSGMMSEKTVSNRFAKHILSDSRNALIFVGYADPASPAGRIQLSKKGDRVVLDESTGYEIDLNCTVDKFDFSGHSTREDIAAYAVSSQAKKIILVHGDPAARQWFSTELETRLPESEIYNAAPGESIRLL